MKGGLNMNWDGYVCEGQISIFDIHTEKIEDVIKEKPWARQCSNGRCENRRGDSICTSLWKCDKRCDYQTVNSYTFEKLGHRGLFYPLGGCEIVCSENKDKIDEMVKRWEKWGKSVPDAK